MTKSIISIMFLFLIMSFPTRSESAFGMNRIYSGYDTTSGYYQIYSKTSPRRIIQLTDSLFDKDSPVWGTNTTDLIFTESETSTSEICSGTLFYYLGDNEGTLNIYLGCLASDGNIINDYPLTGFDESSTFDIDNIYETEGESVTYTYDGIVHDAKPLVFTTLTDETYVLLHDDAEIYNDATNLVFGNIQYFNLNGGSLLWSGTIIYQNSDDDVTVTVDQNSENTNNNENNNSSESNSQNTQTAQTNIDLESPDFSLTRKP